MARCPVDNQLCTCTTIKCPRPAPELIAREGASDFVWDDHMPPIQRCPVATAEVDRAMGKEPRKSGCLPPAEPQRDDGSDFIYGPDTRRVTLPEDTARRNEYPMADGLLDYFPNALAEVSRLSFLSTKQHHPDKPMHWDRSKSTDHRNKIMRHLTDTGTFDDKGIRHSVMVAWRGLALLQEELEREEGAPLSRASVLG